MSQYRDGLAGLVAQVAAKRSSVEDRRRRLTAAVRSMLPAALAAELDTLEATLGAPARDFSALAAADAALDALAVAYDAAIALAPALLECAVAPPDFPRPSAPQPWLIEERPALQFREALARDVAAALGEAEVQRWGDTGYVAFLAETEVPFSLFADLAPPNDVALPAFTISLRTTMPPRLPELRVRRKSKLLAVGSAFGLAKSISIGDATLESAFWIGGSAATASLLGAVVRASLATLSPFDPVLSIAGGLAAIDWRGEFDHWTPRLSIEAARDALVGLRRELGAAPSSS